MGLVMLELKPTSLLYVSLFGLLDAAVQVVFGAAVGAYIDRCGEIPKLTPIKQETSRYLGLQVFVMQPGAPLEQHGH